jgi:hypothetical protein
MDIINKTFAVFLTLIIAMSCLVLMFKSVNAQTTTPTPSPIPIPVPSIPEFAVQLVGSPYVVNTTYHLDENTGQIVPQIGYSNQYSYLEIKIKNQPFMPFVGDQYGNMVQIQYNVRIKQSNETDNWVEVYNPYNGYPIQANSDSFTIFKFPLEGGWDSPLGSIAGTQSDIQVEALAGYVHRMVVGFGAPYVFNGTESGWSKTQTVSIPSNVPMTLSPSPSPTVPEFSWLTIVPLLLAIPIVLVVFLLVMVLRHRKIALSE